MAATNIPTDLLSNPNLKVATVGSRPSALRSVFGLLATLAIGAAVSQGLTHSGVFDEIAARTVASEVQAPQLTSAHWVDMPKIPFIEAARRADGSLDLMLLSAQYSNLGLESAQLSDINSHMKKMEPVLLGVHDPEFEAQIKADANKSNDYLAKHYPRLYEVKPQFSDPLVRLQSGFPADAYQNDTQGMAHALAALEATVEQTGLRALHVPTFNWSSASSLSSLSVKLNQANRELQSVTGWDQGVLGLGGRLELSIDATGTPGSEGLTISSWSHRVKIVTGFDGLAHEWVHGLDFVLAQKAMSASLPHTLSKQSSRLFRFQSDSSITNQWTKAMDQMGSVAPNWQNARLAQAEQTGAEYWKNDAEKMGYAFQAHVAQTSSLMSLPVPVEEYSEAFPFAAPSRSEIQQQAPVWDQLFSSLKHLNLSQTLPPQASARTSLRDLRASRTEAASSPVISGSKAPRF